MFPMSPVHANRRRHSPGVLSLATLLFSLIACAEGTTPLSAGEPNEPAANPKVAITTNRGVIELELFADKAPATVNHILKLVDAQFYDGLTFHRVAANFVIQAGGYDAELNYREPPGTVVNESFNGLSNTKGTVAMARLEEPDSADAQFFINVRDNVRLDAQPGAAGYTVFGQVTSAWPVVVDIELVDTEPQGGMISVPVTPVIIESMRRLP